MYTPHVGRWLSEDPAGYVDGPNQYLYVKNNPINMTDPSGLEGIEDWNPLTFTYGSFCGLLNYGAAGSKKAPIDAVDAACQKHDVCLGPLNYNWCSCSAKMCDALVDGYEFGCKQSYAGIKNADERQFRIDNCKRAAQKMSILFCWVAIGIEHPEGGVSPG